MKNTGGGRNVKFQNYDWPFFSERWNCLFSLSLLQHHNVENGFWVDHYYDNQNIEKNIEIDFRCSDFTYGVKKGHNVKNQNINYLWCITYGYQGLWGPGGLG